MPTSNAFSSALLLEGERTRYSILKDKMFDSCRKVFNSKAIELREKGLGKRKSKSDPLTSDKEELFWRLKVLGNNNQKSFNYTIFYKRMSKTSSAVS